MKRMICICVLCLFVSTIFICGCGKSPKAADNDKIIATINGEPLYVKDFKRALDLNIKRDPTFRITPEILESQMNVLIDKKLLIQQAREMELDQTERFVNTIKTFWEQTLIRDLMSYKDGEFSRQVIIAESEMKDYYDNLGHQKTFQVIQSRDKELVAKLVKMGPESVSWQETIGPISYEDISSDIMRKAFSFEKGAMRAVKEGDMIFLFYVKDDVELPVPSYDEMKEDIKMKIAGMKKQKIFEIWLSNKRSKADIKIKDEVFKGMIFKNE